MFYTGDLASSNLHVRGLSQRLGAVWEDVYLASGTIDFWSGLLTYLGQQTSRRLDMVLDEFPYLCQAEPALPSLLQKLWDESKGSAALVDGIAAAAGFHYPHPGRRRHPPAQVHGD